MYKERDAPSSESPSASLWINGRQLRSSMEDDIPRPMASTGQHFLVSLSAGVRNRRSLHVDMADFAASAVEGDQSLLQWQHTWHSPAMDRWLEAMQVTQDC